MRADLADPHVALFGFGFVRVCIGSFSGRLGGVFCSIRLTHIGTAQGDFNRGFSFTQVHTEIG